MKIYLVGGAVRDTFLGLPVHERDWVVVGATPELMQEQGYRQVGRDFPVFLHPKTHEEYALARTERKNGVGYRGFTCFADPTISLEEDLQRRDLTINAIAMDANGNYIDPYHGLDDLKAKRLCHVSGAFVEDPVRVLRVARFAARYQHLGFTLAEETRRLMYQMVQSGELGHLVKERVWKEWQLSLTTQNPEQFIQVLRACGALQVIFPEIDALFGIPSYYNNHYKDTGIHMLETLQKLAKHTTSPIERFAGAVFELGKTALPFTSWPNHHNYAPQTAPLLQLIKRLHVPVIYQKFALLVHKVHLDLLQLEQLSAENCINLLEKIQAFQRPDDFNQLIDLIALLFAKPKILIWKKLLAHCQAVQATPLVAQGLRGEAIRHALHQQRITILEKWKSHEK